MSPSPDVVWQKLEGEIVLLAMHNDHYYRLDEVGARMWELLCEHGEIDAARGQLLTEFDVDPQRLATDLEAFVTRLGAAGLMAVEPHAA